MAPRFLSLESRVDAGCLLTEMKKCGGGAGLWKKIMSIVFILRSFEASLKTSSGLRLSC